MDKKGKGPGILEPVVDRSKCEGKGPCVQVCPYDVFEIRKIDEMDFKNLSFIGKIKNKVHGGKVAYTPRASACEACGLCVPACPEKAIKLRPVKK